VRACTCPSGLVARYRQRLSGPLLDRIDIFIEVPRVAYEKLVGDSANEPSRAVRARVDAARARQRERPAGTKLAANAELGPAEVRRLCRPDKDGVSLLRAAMAQLNLSARAYQRLLKLARTIADLAGAEEIGAGRIAEALQYRPPRRGVTPRDPPARGPGGAQCPSLSSGRPKSAKTGAWWSSFRTTFRPVR
jgi:magnesium chelatase family protein